MNKKNSRRLTTATLLQNIILLTFLDPPATLPSQFFTLFYFIFINAGPVLLFDPPPPHFEDPHSRRGSQCRGVFRNGAFRTWLLARLIA